VSSHTPGPWWTDDKMDGDSYRNVMSDQRESPVASIWLGRVLDIKREEAEANAELIAQAPELKQQRDDLLAAAKAVVERWDAHRWKDLGATADVIHHLRNAIAKAEAKEVTDEH
jgi:hypothetical protein